MYLVDADVVIKAARHHYAMDFCPAFWQWLECAGNRGQVKIVHAVYDEVVAGGDELSRWLTSHRRHLLLDPTDTLGSRVAEIANWARSQGYAPAQLTKFLSGADPFLIAEACARGATVVTEERERTPGRGKVKIPDVCDAMMVSCLQPWEMLRRQQARFVLPPEQLPLPL